MITQVSLTGPRKRNFGFKKSVRSLAFFTMGWTLGPTAIASTIPPRAVIKVDGMVCYSCSYGLEKQCKFNNRVFSVSCGSKLTLLPS